MQTRKRIPAFEHPQAGFTLIEVLVAMVVLTLLASILLRGTVAVRSDAAWLLDDAARGSVAQNVLDNALRNRKLRDGTYTGTRDGWTWTLVATQVDLGNQIGRPSPEAPGGVTQPAWRPQRLVVTVGTRDAPASLETLRLVAP